MGIIKKMATKIGFCKRRYYTLMVRRDDYFTVKALAAQEKMTHVDLVHKLLAVYLQYKAKNHEAIIAENITGKTDINSYSLLLLMFKSNVALSITAI